MAHEKKNKKHNISCSLVQENENAQTLHRDKIETIGLIRLTYRRAPSRCLISIATTVLKESRLEPLGCFPMMMALICSERTFHHGMHGLDNVVAISSESHLKLQAMGIHNVYVYAPYIYKM